MNILDNDAGRPIPASIVGYGGAVPWREGGIPPLRAFKPVAHRQRQPLRLASIEEAIGRSALADGMRISFHHHLRMGDLVVALVIDSLTRMGFKNLTLCVSSIMGPACGAVLEAVKAGVITSIETTGMKEPLAQAVIDGVVPYPVIFRSHGGRARVIEEGQIVIDVAFIAASAIDGQGNLYGTVGKNPFGSMGYAHADAAYASCVIAITDTLLEAVDVPYSIEGSQVDWIVEVDSIGDASLMSGGSLRLSQSPLERLIASQTLAVLIASGAVVDGFNYQAGSGGISLLISSMLQTYMVEHSIKGGFASGGITASLVEMAHLGLFSTLWDVQSFDDRSVASLGTNSFHREMSASLYANPNNIHCIAHRLDVMILSATEVDLSFNVNSITGTNGRILGALGGAPDTAWGSKLVVVVMPTFRNRIPMIHPQVNLVCTPGQDVDVVVTERGIAVNPRRDDLIQRLTEASLPVLPIETLMEHTFSITGRPDYPHRGDAIRAVVEYRDGSVLDCLRV
ncbi:MAG: citrate lyase subunit alpha [Sphaerochaeta sp.]|nr:citrate lyase subunit alpha [Sphaerochaeta sp.]